MKVVIIGADPETIDSRLPWPDVTKLTAASVGDGMKLVEEAAPDLVLLQLDFSRTSLLDALKKLRCLTDAPLLVLDSNRNGLRAFIPTGQGEDAPVMLPPLPRRRRQARHAELQAKKSV